MTKPKNPRPVNAVTQCEKCRKIHQPGDERWVFYRHNGMEHCWLYYCPQCHDGEGVTNGQCTARDSELPQPQGE